MPKPIQIDVENLKAKRSAYVAQIAAIDKVLEGVAELAGILDEVGVDVGKRGIGTSVVNLADTTTEQPSKPNTRVRRSKVEVAAIKDATLREARFKAGTKAEIFDRLVASEEVLNTRKDSELVLRTLKDFVKDEKLFQALGGVFTADPAGQAMSPRTYDEMERRGIIPK